MEKGNGNSTASAVPNEIDLGTVRVCTTHGTVYFAKAGCPKC